MKEKDLEFGSFKVGSFVIHVKPPVFSEEHADNTTFFEVLITEERTLRNEKGSSLYPFYIHLVNDKRFGLFSDFGKFNKTIRIEESIEYTSYFYRQKMIQPTWRLSRGTLCDVFDLAQESKRRTQNDVLNDLKLEEFEANELLILNKKIKDFKLINNIKAK